MKISLTKYLVGFISISHFFCVSELSGQFFASYSQQNFLYSVILHNENDTVIKVLGILESPIGAQTKAQLRWYDNNSLQLVRVIHYPKGFYPSSSQPVFHGGKYYWSGIQYDTVSSGNSYLTIMKLDSACNFDSFHQIKELPPGSMESSTLLKINGGYYCGYVNLTGSPDTSYLFKLDGALNKVDSVKIRGTLSDCKYKNGTMYLLGYDFEVPCQNKNAVQVLKLDTMFNKLVCLSIDSLGLEKFGVFTNNIKVNGPYPKIHPKQNGFYVLGNSSIAHSLTDPPAKAITVGFINEISNTKDGISYWSRSQSNAFCSPTNYFCEFEDTLTFVGCLNYDWSNFPANQEQKTSMLVVRITGNANEIVKVVLGGDMYYLPKAIDVSDYGIIIAGFRRDTSEKILPHNNENFLYRLNRTYSTVNLGDENPKFVPIQIYPNPSDGLFTLISNINGEVKFFDVSGRLVSELTLSAEVKENVFLSKGLYFYQFNGKAVNASGKILVQY